MSLLRRSQLKKAYLLALTTGMDGAAVELVNAAPEALAGKAAWDEADPKRRWRNWALLEAAKAARATVVTHLLVVGAGTSAMNAALRRAIEAEWDPAMPTLRALLRKEPSSIDLTAALWSALERNHADAALTLMQTGAFRRGYEARLLADLAVKKDHIGLAEHCIRQRSLVHLRRAANCKAGEGRAIRAFLAAYDARQATERALHAATAWVTP